MRVVVAGGSALLRDLLAGAFTHEPDIEVSATLATLAEVLVSCRDRRPDVLVTDTAFGDGALVGVLAEILLRGTRVLVVCARGSAADAHDLLFAGASGALFVDDVAAADVVDAARDVAAGNAALHPAAAAAVLRLWRAARGGDIDAARREAVQLSRREFEVLDGLARGRGNRELARDLAVSPRTVEAHVARLFVKLGARNRAHAVSLAEERGLLTARGAGDRDERTGHV